MSKKTDSAKSILVLYVLICLALLVLILGGAKVYSAALSSESENLAERSALSYVQTQVNAKSGRDAVSIKDGPEGKMLAIAVDDEFETKIYEHAGALVTELGLKELAPIPENADKICEISSVEFAWEEVGLLKITCDGKVAYAHVMGVEPAISSKQKFAQSKDGGGPNA